MNLGSSIPLVRITFLNLSLSFLPWKVEITLFLQDCTECNDVNEMI